MERNNWNKTSTTNAMYVVSHGRRNLDEIICSTRTLSSMNTNSNRYPSSQTLALQPPYLQYTRAKHNRASAPHRRRKTIEFELPFLSGTRLARTPCAVTNTATLPQKRLHPKPSITSASRPPVGCRPCLRTIGSLCHILRKACWTSVLRSVGILPSWLNCILASDSNLVVLGGSAESCAAVCEVFICKMRAWDEGMDNTAENIDHATILTAAILEEKNVAHAAFLPAAENVAHEAFLTAAQCTDQEENLPVGEAKSI
mmetsp:Transcript_3855/g.10284  ORF Transcript_3855/g.10284 Transcript_3855/m.10284 type:complete len:257 (-) Transcript_3855:64-834(-)